MKYLTVRLEPAEGEGFHPLGKRLTAEPTIQREAIHHVELLEDGSMMTLAEGSGDKERYEEIMSSSPSVHEYMLSGDSRWMAVSRFDPTDSVREILEWRQQANVALETPILFGVNGAQRVTVLGDESAFKTLFEAGVAVEEVTFEVLKTGEYAPGPERLTRLLTTRQEEVLTNAVDVGYYKTPREATHEDVAEAVGLAPSTVGEHLRKIEERVFEAIVH